MDNTNNNSGVNNSYNYIQNFINKFELKLFQDFHYNLRQKSLAVDMDLEALYYQYDDFMDELSKQNALPDSVEIVIKLA